MCNLYKLFDFRLVSVRSGDLKLYGEFEEIFSFRPIVT